MFAPETKRDWTLRFVKPELAGTQDVPLSDERKTPLFVPAKTVESESAKHCTGPVNPEFAEVQLVPLFVERYTPSFDAAKRFEPETITDWTVSFGKPVDPQFAALQVPPLSVETNVAVEVPATMVVVPPPAEIAIAWMAVFVRLVPFHVDPLSVEKKTPRSSVPRKRFAPFTTRE